MKLVLDRNAVLLLHNMIRNPAALPLQAANQKVFSVGEKYDRLFHLIRLENWFIDHCLIDGEKLPDKTITVGIKQAYADLLLELVRHYQPLGAMAFGLTKYYVDLRNQLEDKKMSEDDAWEDPYKPDPKPKSEPEKDLEEINEQTGI